MTSDRIDRAAALLAAAWWGREAIPGLPADALPADEVQAYAVQDALRDRLGLEPAAWKVACTTPEAQARLSTRTPFGGPLPRAALHTSPATIPAASHSMRMIEGELAFILACDLPARPAPYTRAEVEAAIITLHPAIEVADTRYRDWLAADKPALIADLAVSGALVLGPGTEDWRDLDLPALAARMVVGGAVVGQGTGRDALGHPALAVLWLANHLAARGQGLRAGEVVTTGSCTGNYMAVEGDAATAIFDGLGVAKVRFT
jgi:2-keto-4-pentenoate hydratase